jgi:hypothetical protein
VAKSRGIKCLPSWSPQERLDFRSIPEPNSGCLLWLGAATKDGYGSLVIMGVSHRAHRLAWELKNGPVPEGLCVCHKCDVRLCMNVDHLWIGTDGQNREDKIKKGRCGSPRGEQSIFARTTADVVRRVRQATGSYSEIAEQFGIGYQSARKIRLRETWKHVK